MSDPRPLYLMDMGRTIGGSLEWISLKSVDNMGTTNFKTLKYSNQENVKKDTFVKEPKRRIKGMQDTKRCIPQKKVFTGS